MHSGLSYPRLIAIGVLLAILPAGIYLPPLGGLGGMVLVLAALITLETNRYSELRHTLRAQGADGEQPRGAEGEQPRADTS